MLVEAFFSTLVSFCLVQLLHNTAIKNLANWTKKSFKGYLKAFKMHLKHFKGIKGNKGNYGFKGF